ncbi:hypothetical protein A5747_04840 [Mycobacterium sp. IS-836]|uniref:hypothetical protein n=1 Tax=Mycobacterium sp. IS-836 TaxID=1834160 RepID=UPI00096F1D64|nr:hypothetical protein [Mycobacterium sp. IS-836]OMC57121.1 hypothetical protein A5747_04840 [Mycobacterium sp. IS-836]
MTLKRLVAGALVSGAIATAGLGMAVGVAHADPFGHVGGNCPAGHTCGHWCPGERIPDNFINWNMGVCHEYYYDYRGVVDTGNGAVYGWPSGPINAPPRHTGPPNFNCGLFWCPVPPHA